MINKKYLIVFYLTASLISFNAFAKTEGSYFGVDALGTSVNLRHANDGDVLDNTKLGVGLHYNYAFNNNGLFLSPAIFVERNAVRGKDKNVGLRGHPYRSGLKLDFGYDLTDNFAAYITGGISRLDYSSDSIETVKGNGSLYTSYGAFYGAGLLFHIAKEATLSLEYNMQNYNSLRAREAFSEKSSANIQVVKLGIAYHF